MDFKQNVVFPEGSGTNIPISEAIYHIGLLEVDDDFANKIKGKFDVKYLKREIAKKIFEVDELPTIPAVDVEENKILNSGKSESHPYAEQMDIFTKFLKNYFKPTPVKDIETGQAIFSIGLNAVFNEVFPSFAGNEEIPELKVEIKRRLSGVKQKIDTEEPVVKEEKDVFFENDKTASVSMTPENDEKNEKVSRKPWTHDEEEKFKALKKAGLSYKDISKRLDDRSVESLKQKSKYMNLDDEVLPEEQAAGVADSINKLNLSDDSKISGNINIFKHLNTLLSRDSEVLNEVWKELREGKIHYNTYLRASNRSLSNLTKGNFLKIIIAEGKNIAMNEIKQKIISVMKDVMINMPEEARTKFKEALDAGIDELNKNIINESLQNDAEGIDDEEQEEE